MKRVLLSCFLFAIGIIRVNGQSCTVSDLEIVVKDVVSTANGCQATLDLKFNGQFNNGNKFAFVHLWETAPVNYYPNIDYTITPTAAQLANVTATIVIKDPGASNASLHNQYPSDPSVPVKYSGVGFSKSGSEYTMTNVVINFSTCDVPVTVKGDVWASQSNTAQNVHCSNGGMITILFNDPVINGFKQCSSPRRLMLSFENAHATLNESVEASVFLDVNMNNVIDGGDIDITSALSPALPQPISLPAVTKLNFNNMTYEPYSSQLQYNDVPIIVRARATATGAATVTITKAGINTLGCSTLPVTFTSFTAKRNESVVNLQWQTASETNNNGFAVEREENNVWKQIAYVFSQADGGNSSSTLTYKYDDKNVESGVTRYRLKQIDINGDFKYSEVVSVTGVSQKAKLTVYPNPTTSGRVQVVFESGSNDPHHVSLMDMSGRMIRQWKSVRNNMQIDNLQPGVYHLLVVNAQTGAQSVEKILVSKN